MPTSVRLDSDSDALLQRLARESGRTKSEVIRDALHEMANNQRASGDGDSLHALISDLIGIADEQSRPPARDHKKAFREKLAERARG